MGSIVVRGEGFFCHFFVYTDGRRDDDRGIGREGGARRTGLKSPSLLSLDRSLTISSTSPTSAASCSGLRFGEGVRGRVSGARAGRSRMSFARREHSTRRRWKSGDPGGIGPSRAYREARALTRHRHRRRRRSRTSCETLGARQGSPRRNAPSLFVGNTGSTFSTPAASVVSMWYRNHASRILPRWPEIIHSLILFYRPTDPCARRDRRTTRTPNSPPRTTRWPP